MATFYIGPNGDDTTGDGSLGNPWLNLEYAINNSNSTDTIIVKKGITIQTLSASISPQSRIIEGETENPEDSVIDFNDNDFRDFQSNGETHIYRNLTIIHIKLVNTNRSTFSTNYGTTEVSNCIFKNNDISSTNDNRQPTGHFFGANSGGDVPGTYIIDKCLFLDNYVNLSISSSQDSACYFTTTDLMNVTVTNCNFINTDAPNPTDKVKATGIIGGDGSSTASLLFENNIFSNKGFDPCIYQWNFGSPLTAGVLTTKNCCFDNIEFESTYPYSETIDCIQSDPLFVDYKNEIFNLRPTSPCIGLGI